MTYFTNAFDAMVSGAAITQLSLFSRHLLLEEFKSVHQRYGNSVSKPFAVLRAAFRDRGISWSESSAARDYHLSDVLRAFDDTRDRTLALYPGVGDGLRSMSDAGTILIGLTDAVSLQRCIASFSLRHRALFYARVYCRGGQLLPHPSREDTANQLAVIRELHPHERKPDPAVLLNICELAGDHARRYICSGR